MHAYLLHTCFIPAEEKTPTFCCVSTAECNLLCSLRTIFYTSHQLVRISSFYGGAVSHYKKILVLACVRMRMLERNIVITRLACRSIAIIIVNMFPFRFITADSNRSFDYFVFFECT